MKAFRLAGLVAFVLGVAACSGSSTGDDDDGATTPPASPTPTVTPLFETHILPIITASCGGSNNACHSRVAYGASSANDCRGWLTLEDTIETVGEVVRLVKKGEPGGPPGMAVLFRTLDPAARATIDAYVITRA